MRGRTNTSAGSGTKISISGALKSYKVAPGNTIDEGNFISFKNTFSYFPVTGAGLYYDENSDDFCKINETDFLHVYSDNKVMVTYCRMIEGEVKIISSKQVSEKIPAYGDIVKIIGAGSKAFVFYYYEWNTANFLEYIPITLSADDFLYGESVKTNIQTGSEDSSCESFSISMINEHYLWFVGAWIAGSKINGAVIIKINDNNLEFGTILPLKGITLIDRKVNCNVVNNSIGLVMAEGILYNLGLDLPTMTVTLIQKLDLKGSVPLQSRKVFFMDNMVLFFWSHKDTNVLYVVGAVCNENGMTLLNQVEIISNYTSSSGPAVHDLGNHTVLVSSLGYDFWYKIDSDISLIDTALNGSRIYGKRIYKMSDTIGFFGIRTGENSTGYTTCVVPYTIANLDIEPFSGETFAENFKSGIIKGISKNGGSAGEKIDVYVPTTV